MDLLGKETLSSIVEAPEYRLTLKTLRKVDREGYVNYGRSRYSVPPSQVGKTVIVEQDERRIIVRSDDLIIASHDAARKSGSCVTDKQHVGRCGSCRWGGRCHRPRSGN